MRISRTNTPTQSSVIVSLEGEKKKKTQLNNASNQAPSVLPLPPAPSHPSLAFLTSFSTSRRTFSPSHLFPSAFWESDLYPLLAAARKASALALCASVYVGYKVPADLHQVTLAYVFINETPRL